MRMNRRIKKDVLDKVFVALQAEGIINIDVAVFFLDSTTVRVHPDACVTLKKEENKQSKGCATVLLRKSIR